MGTITWKCKCGKIRIDCKQCGYCGDKPNSKNILNANTPETVSK